MSDATKYAAMAAVLGELGAEIEALGEVLCRDSDFAARHLRQLQAIDLIAQKQRALATLMDSGFSEEQLSRITIDALRSRFCGFVNHAKANGAASGDLNLWD
jgi:hypothetical protein